MANQQAPRQWFRLASISRPAPQEATPTPEPTPALPRTTTIRPAFRPVGGTSSVPSSPVSGGRASQPSSPPDKKPQVTPRTASVPNSPVKTAQTATRPTTSPPKPATTSSLPSSPAKPVASITASVSSSPAKPVATTASVTTSPTKKVASTVSVPSSPAKTVASTVSVPSSPAKTVASIVSVPSSVKIAPTTSVRSPPIQNPASFTTTTTTTRAGSQKASIPTVKPAMQSPIQSTKIKAPTAPPPSPLTLPPAQLRRQTELEPKIPVEAEEKTVLVQNMVEKPRGLFAVPQKDVGGDSRHPSNHGPKESFKYGETKEKSNGKKLSSDSEDTGMRVITIAGENKGAFMELIRSSPHKNGFQGSLQKTVTRNDGSDYHSYSSSDKEGDRKTKGKSNRSKSNTMPLNTYMNSNVQGVNNSIVYNSSYTHHDPGVHLSLHRKPTADGFHVKERTNGYNS